MALASPHSVLPLSLPSHYCSSCCFVIGYWILSFCIPFSCLPCCCFVLAVASLSLSSHVVFSDCGLKYLYQ
ncbi:hypothetical protein BDR06DRAFT_542130 [Suillus hirtellus]|nr:hypothetical protein BDR06DRAFT_542130 [Suillus hirtellus]